MNNTIVIPINQIVKLVQERAEEHNLSLTGFNADILADWLGQSPAFESTPRIPSDSEEDVVTFSGGRLIVDVLPQALGDIVRAEVLALFS
jgi:hypothetical protein